MNTENLFRSIHDQESIDAFLKIHEKLSEKCSLVLNWSINDVLEGSFRQLNNGYSDQVIGSGPANEVRKRGHNLRRGSSTMATECEVVIAFTTFTLRSLCARSNIEFERSDLSKTRLPSMKV